MTKTRLEAFSDGVIAIIITIMVLEFKVPTSSAWADVKELFPALFGYLLSFVFIAIYWVNHHHLMHTIKNVSSGILWSNMHLLFWLSLIPFATSWMDKAHFDKNSVIVYAVLASCCGFAYYILLKAISKKEKGNSKVQKILERQSKKGLLSNIFYLAAIIVAFIQPKIALALFAVVSLMWIIPDKQIEKVTEL